MLNCSESNVDDFIVYAYFSYAANSSTEIDDVTKLFVYRIFYSMLVLLLRTFYRKNVDSLTSFHKIFFDNARVLHF